MDVKFIKLNDIVQTPTFNFDKKTEWFVKYGDDNKLPENILTWYNSVGLHRAIIQKKVNMFVSDGVAGR